MLLTSNEPLVRFKVYSVLALPNFDNITVTAENDRIFEAKRQNSGLEELSYSLQYRSGQRYYSLQSRKTTPLSSNTKFHGNLTLVVQLDPSRGHILQEQMKIADDQFTRCFE